MNLVILIAIVGVFIIAMIAIMRHTMNRQKDTIRNNSDLYKEAVRIVRDFVKNPNIQKPINGHNLLRIITPALDMDTALEAIAEGVDGQKDLIVWEMEQYDTE
jgi:hypothetical protein